MQFTWQKTMPLLLFMTAFSMFYLFTEETHLANEMNVLTVVLFFRYQYRRGHGTTVVPQYHEYRGTTVWYLPTNSHFSEDFRAQKNSLLTG